MRDRRVAYATLVFVAVLFGGTWPAGKVAVEHVRPLPFAAARFAISAVLLVAWARTTGRRVPLPRRADLPLVLALGATGIAAYNAFFLYGLERAPATDGAILVPGLIPVLTTLLAWPAFGERPTRRVAAGFAVALVGLVFVVDPAGAVGTTRLEGDAILVGASVCWAAYTILGRAATRRFDSVVATAYAAIAGTILLAPCTVGGWGSFAHAPWSLWVSLAYFAPLATVLAFVLFYEGVRAIGAAKASAFTLLVPVFGVLASVLVLDERLHARVALGGAIVVAGLALVQRRRGPDAVVAVATTPAEGGAR